MVYILYSLTGQDENKTIDRFFLHTWCSSYRPFRFYFRINCQLLFFLWMTEKQQHGEIIRGKLIDSDVSPQIKWHNMDSVWSTEYWNNYGLFIPSGIDMMHLWCIVWGQQNNFWNMYLLLCKLEHSFSVCYLFSKGTFCFITIHLNNCC